MQTRSKTRELEEETRGELSALREQIRSCTLELELKRREEKSLDISIRRFYEQLESKSVELDEIKRSVEEQSHELAVKRKRCSSIQWLIQKNLTELAATEKRQEKMSEALADCILEIECKKTTLAKTEESIKKLSEEIRSKEMCLDTVQRNLRQSIMDLESKQSELDVVKETLRKYYNDLELKEKNIVLLQSSISDYGKEIESKEKRVQELESRVRAEQDKLSCIEKSRMDCSERVEAKRKEFGRIERSIKKLHDEIATKEYELASHNEKNALMQVEARAALLSSRNPAVYVLEQIERVMLESFEESRVKYCVLLLEELTRVARHIEPQPRYEALGLASRWKGNMQIRTSPTIPLVFLLLVVAYSLVGLFDHDEILRLAGPASHYKHAPKLFESLGLSYEVPGIVQQLIRRQHYVPAVRFMCYFKIKDVLSPSCLLKMEIDKLRQSSTGAWRMRSILELIAEYKLEIDLPGDLVAKLMLHQRRENQSQSVASTSFVQILQEPAASTPAIPHKTS